MNRENFFLSFGFAWRRRPFRFFCLGVAGAIIAFGGWYAWRIIPLRHQPDIVFHYTIYLGIDDVRGWPWLWLPLGAWWSLAALDILLGFVYYRTDPFAAWALAASALFISVPWAFSLYYLTVVNV